MKTSSVQKMVIDIAEEHGLKDKNIHAVLIKMCGAIYELGKKVGADAKEKELMSKKPSKE